MDPLTILLLIAVALNINVSQVLIPTISVSLAAYAIIRSHNKDRDIDAATIDAFSIGVIKEAQTSMAAALAHAEQEILQLRREVRELRAELAEARNLN